MDGREHRCRLGSVAQWTTKEEDAWDLVAHICLWQDLPSIDVEYMQISGDADSGQAVYERMQCGACHGADGEGVLAMSLNNPVFHQFASDGFIYHAIAKGRAPTTMPAYEDVLTEQEMQDLVAYQDLVSTCGAAR